MQLWPWCGSIWSERSGKFVSAKCAGIGGASFQNRTISSVVTDAASRLIRAIPITMIAKQGFNRNTEKGRSWTPPHKYARGKGSVMELNLDEIRPDDEVTHIQNKNLK